jgi:uncharacterized membrane protein YtjA (UPF0391 family)
MRITVVALVFGLITAALGLTGHAGDLADYFRVLSAFFLITFAGLLLGRLLKRRVPVEERR